MEKSKPDLKQKSLKISVKELENAYNLLKDNKKDDYKNFVSKCIKEKKFVELLKFSLVGEYTGSQISFLRKHYKKEDVSYELNPTIYEKLFLNNLEDYEEIINNNEYVKIDTTKLIFYIFNKKKECDILRIIEKYKDIIDWEIATPILTRNFNNLYGYNHGYCSFIEYLNFKKQNEFSYEFFKNIKKLSRESLYTINVKNLLSSFEEKGKMYHDIELDKSILKLLNYDKLLENVEEENNKPINSYFDEINISNFSNIKMLIDNILRFDKKEAIRYVLDNRINVFLLFVNDYNFINFSNSYPLYDNEIVKEKIEIIKWYSHIIFHSEINIENFYNYEKGEYLDFIKIFLDVYKEI